MSGETLVTVIPPGDAIPSVLHLSAEQVPISADGTFTVKAKYLPSLMAAGWQIAVASGTTHVP